MLDVVKNIYNKIKNPLKAGAAVVAMSLLPSACKEKPQPDKEPIKDLSYYYNNKLPLNIFDMCGNCVVGYTIEIKIYKDATLNNDESDMTLVRWGVPKKDLARSFDMKDTHAEYVYLDEVGSSKGWIEVFDNEYGVSICKDQPCFLVNKEGRLRLIGDADSYDRNLRSYKAALDHEAEMQRLKAEKKQKLYREKKQNLNAGKGAFATSQNMAQKADMIYNAKGADIKNAANDSVNADSINKRLLPSVSSDTIRADSLSRER